MANAMSYGNNAMKAPLGAGLARGAADVISMRKKWQDERINGETTLQFKAWLKKQGITNPVME